MRISDSILHPTPHSALFHGHIHAALSAQREPRAALLQQLPGTYDHVLVGRVHGVNDRDLRGEGIQRAQRTRRGRGPGSRSPSPPARPGAAAGPGARCTVPGAPCAVPRAATEAAQGCAQAPHRAAAGSPPRSLLPRPPPPVPGPSPPHHGGGGPAELPARPLPALRRGTPVPRTTGPAAPRPPATPFRSCRVPGAAAACAGQGEGEGRERGLACPAPGTRAEPAERPGARAGPGQNPLSAPRAVWPGSSRRRGVARHGTERAAPRAPQSPPPWPASRTTSPACWRK